VNSAVSVKVGIIRYFYADDCFLALKKNGAEQKTVSAQKSFA